MRDTQPREWLCNPARRWLATFLALIGLSHTGAAAIAQTVETDRWSFTIQGAAGLPQDVWIAALGSNSNGWLGGGSICLGPLAQGFEPGQSVTLLIDVVEAGVFGIDGAPVPTTDAAGNPVVYFAPGIELPGRSFTLREGASFYAILDAYVVESTTPDVFPVGVHLPVMFTFEYVEGRVEQELALWTQDASGQWVPTLNEGLMSTNIRRTR
jgi:hypothetical protein